MSAYSKNRDNSIAMANAYWLIAYIFLTDLNNKPAYLASKSVQYCYFLGFHTLAQLFNNYLLRPTVSLQEWEFIASKKRSVHNM